MITKQQPYFLQSNEWALFQKALGNTVISDSGDGWGYVAILEKGYGRVGKLFSRLYCPYGPFFDNEDSLKNAFDSLNEQAKTHGVDYIRVEPVSSDKSYIFSGGYGYRKCGRTSQPDLTLQIDLTKDTRDIMLDMTKTNRYLWNKSERAGLSFKILYDINALEPFIDMMNETSERTKAKFRQKNYYETLLKTLGYTKNVGISYVYHNNEELSGVLFADDFIAKRRYYLYAGSFDKARKFSANSPLVTYLILNAKNAGFTSFDFFGLSPITAVNHRWAGFSKFKRSFGGQEVSFSGTWEKPIRKSRYKAMNIIRKLA